MDTALPTALVVGLLLGVGVHELLVADWFLALGLATVYASSGYFLLAFEVSLLDTVFDFEDRTDRLGYGLGVFGLSVSPLALAEQYGSGGTATLVVVLLFVGVIAFFLLVSKAHRRAAGGR
jgi:hypothetical protein